MNNIWGSGFIRVVVSVGVAAFLLTLAGAKEGLPLERTWKTKDGKHSVEATLVEHSFVDVTLKLKNGKTKTIKLSLMSSDDVDYLKGFPSLEGKAKPTNLPWVRVQAKAKARKRTGTSRSLVEFRQKSMEVSVANRSKEDLDITILYGFLVEDLSGRNGVMRQTRLSDLDLKGVRIKQIKLGGQKDTSFVTEVMHTAEVNGRTKGGSKDQSFVVQAYWKGQLLHGWAADSNLDTLAKDGGLLERVGGGRYR